MSFTINVQDQQVKAALQALSKRLNTREMDAMLLTIGAGIIERTNRRFETSTGPDGVPWKQLSATSVDMLTRRLSSQKSKVTKSGSLNKAGRTALAGKKLLINSNDLRREFVAIAASNTLTVTNTMAYAAIHQFGGTTGAKSWIPGKQIPARPFLPIRKDETLYPAEQKTILAELNQYLMDSL